MVVRLKATSDQSAFEEMGLVKWVNDDISSTRAKIIRNNTTKISQWPRNPSTGKIDKSFELFPIAIRQRDKGHRQTHPSRGDSSLKGSPREGAKKSPPIGGFILTKWWVCFCLYSFDCFLLFFYPLVYLTHFSISFISIPAVTTKPHHKDTY